MSLENDPRLLLLKMRLAIEDAISGVDKYNYDDVTERLRKIKKEARELFTEFDKYYSGDEDDP